MRFDLKLEEDDEKFVRAASDSAQATMHIDQLSKTRRTFSKVMVIQWAIFIFNLILEVFSRVILKEKIGFWFSSIAGFGVLMYVVLFFYYDVQVKFLKATLAHIP